MKRFIAALSFAVAVPAAMAADVGAPFEQTELDRALPQVSESATAGASRARAERGLPFEQMELDRAPAPVAEKARGDRAAAQPWLDHNFVAPAL